MKKLLTLSLPLILVFATGVLAQTPNSSTGTKTNSKQTSKRGPVFRATKDQINQAQALLKGRGFYSGEQLGKLDDVGFGSNASVSRCPTYVRSTPSIGRFRTRSALRIWAKSGIAQRQRSQPASLPSSSLRPLATSFWAQSKPRDRRTASPEVHLRC